MVKMGLKWLGCRWEKFKMHKRYYAAQSNKAIIQVITELGKNSIQISVGNSKLNWYQIDLDDDQTRGLLKFLKDNKVGEWE
jgi:hypothetical protein